MAKEAMARAARDAERVVLDWERPPLHIPRADRDTLATDEVACPACGRAATRSPDKVKARATKHTLRAVIAAAFPQGMGGHDGEVWADWQRAMDDDGDREVIVTRGMLRWANKYLGNDELKVPFSVAGWRTDVAPYFADLERHAEAVADAAPEPTER